MIYRAYEQRSIFQAPDADTPRPGTHPRAAAAPPSTAAPLLPIKPIEIFEWKLLGFSFASVNVIEQVDRHRVTGHMITQ